MNTQFLKWGALVIVLLGVALFAVGISPYTAKAASLVETQSPPPSGQCELGWEGDNNIGGGNVSLDTSNVPDMGIAATLNGYTKPDGTTMAGYNLLCSDLNVTTCTLVASSFDPPPFGAVDVTLYLTNLGTDSWLYGQLINANVKLQCR